MAFLKKIGLFFHRYRLSILSGILIGTSYIPFPPWALLFCFIPLWLYWWREPSTVRIVISGWITQFVLTFIGFNWVAHTIHEFGHIPRPLAFLALLAFCSFANLYIPIVGWIWATIRNRFQLSALSSLLLLPPLTALAESFIPTIFPWNYGYPWLWAGWPGFHIAEWIGFQGLSALTLALNALALLVWINRRTNMRPFLIGFIATFVGLNVVGWVLGRQVEPGERKIRIQLVQANIGNLEKQYAESGWGFRETIVDKYIALSREGIDSSSIKPDFSVWPETAFPDNLMPKYIQNAHTEKLRNFLKETEVSLITGGYGVHPDSEKTTNSFYILDSQGEVIIEPYHKTMLLAFGEYFPGAELFPRLRELVPEVGDFHRGSGPQVKSANGHTLAPQICYESLFPDFSRQLADQGAEIFVNLTNDSWYGKWQQPYQHLYMTAARAVEFRRPVIRATNTGFSTIVLASGEVLDVSPLHEPWQKVYEFSYGASPKATIFQKTPWLVTLVLLALVVGLIVVNWAQRLKRDY